MFYGILWRNCHKHGGSRELSTKNEVGSVTRDIIVERSKIGVNVWDIDAAGGSIAKCRVC